jgi:hypothetical protein
MDVRFVRGPKSIAKIEAAYRIPFQIFKTHGNASSVGLRQSVLENA